jgi:hypothetical protein
MRRRLLWLIPLAMVIAGTALFLVRYNLGPPGILGSALRTEEGNRGTVLILTGQLERHLIQRRLTGSDWGPSRQHVDLLGLDAATMQLLWKRRLFTSREDPVHDAMILGAEGGVVWLFVRQLLAIAASTGEPIMDVAALQSRNKELLGLMPTDSRFYQFEDGLVVTTVDGRKHRITSPDFRVAPHETRQPQDALTQPPGVFRPAYYTPNSTLRFQEREIHFGQRWFGLLASEDETKPLLSAPLRSGYDWIPGMGGPPQRFGLWVGNSELVPADPGRPASSEPGSTYVRILDVQRLPDAPEFLSGGFLMEVGRGSPVRVSDPDGFLVLHADRIDDARRLRLTRLDFTGRVLWIAALPLSVLQSVLPGRETLVLRGVQFQPADPGRRRDPFHTAVQLLVSVDLRSGTVRGYNVPEEASFSPP